MQFIDLISIDFKHLEYSDETVLASILYLILGGRDVMGAFNFEYEHMFSTFMSDE